MITPRKRNLAAEIPEGFEALPMHRDGQRVWPLRRADSVTKPSEPSVDIGALRDHLVALETALHDPATRRDRARVDALLHRDFDEVGRSGTRLWKGRFFVNMVANNTEAMVQRHRWMSAYAWHPVGSKALQGQFGITRIDLGALLQQFDVGRELRIDRLTLQGRERSLTC